MIWCASGADMVAAGKKDGQEEVLLKWKDHSHLHNSWLAVAWINTIDPRRSDPRSDLFSFLLFSFFVFFLYLCLLP